MSGHWVIAPKRNERALFHARVHEEIAADEKTLIGIAAPDPAVALDSVEEENTAAQAECVLSYIPYLI
jgi:hypothetical protein